MTQEQLFATRDIPIATPTPASTALPLSLKETLASLTPLPASSKEFRLQTRQEILLNLNILILITLNNNLTGTQTYYDIAVLTTLSPLC